MAKQGYVWRVTMECRQCQGIEKTFTPQVTSRELKNYRRKGPDKTTLMLIGAIREAGVEGSVLLDIGGGVGAIQHALIRAGAEHATSVDASTGYTEALRQEATHQGHADRITQIHGNFVDVAPTLEEADIVTLDRVICCFDDMPALVSASVAKARRVYGLVYPRDTWLLRGVVAIQHFMANLFRGKMRFFAHRTAEVDALVRSYGFEPLVHFNAGFWQVVTYARSGG
jgi:magnesium-protoporphyrin O-methyltransferase